MTFRWLKIFKILVLLAGFIFGFFFGGDGFGIEMGMTNFDPYWVTLYAYCLLSVFPAIFLSCFLPRLGGSWLICAALFSFILLLKSSFKGLSLVTEANIFRENMGHYSIELTIFWAAGPMLFLGLSSFFIGWMEKKYTSSNKNQSSTSS